MLTLQAGALLAVLLGAASAREPITGAFGLEFAEPVAETMLGASLGVVPYPAPPANLEQGLPEPVPQTGPNWFLFTPQAVPPLLQAPGVRFMVLIGDAGVPMRILAEHPAPDCTRDMLWLSRSLARIYDAPDDPYGSVREGFRHSARFQHAGAQIDISCGPRLLIEYTEGDTYRGWLAARRTRLADYQAEQQRLEAERELLHQERLRRFADTFTVGDPFRLQGALGVRFGEPLDPSLIDQSTFLVDQSVAAHPLDLPEPFAAGRIEVTLGPDYVPVRIEGELDDPGMTHFERVDGALRAKYGKPEKDTATHKIYKVNGDFLVARYLTDSARLRLVFIDDEGRRAQKAREVAAHEARLAEQRRQFEQETLGL